MYFLFRMQIACALREQEAPDEHSKVCPAWRPEQHLKLGDTGTDCRFIPLLVHSFARLLNDKTRSELTIFLSEIC